MTRNLPRTRWARTVRAYRLYLAVLGDFMMLAMVVLFLAALITLLAGVWFLLHGLWARLAYGAAMLAIGIPVVVELSYSTWRLWKANFTATLRIHRNLDRIHDDLAALTAHHRRGERGGAT